MDMAGLRCRVLAAATLACGAFVLDAPEPVSLGFAIGNHAKHHSHLRGSTKVPYQQRAPAFVKNGGL